MEKLRHFIDNEPFFDFLYPVALGSDQQRELQAVNEWKHELRKINRSKK